VTRIASVKPHPISVPLKDVPWTAHEELKASSVIVVEVRTDDGLTGYGQIMAAIGGIDIALRDIKGKHAGLPVWRLLAGDKRPIPT